jgi:hypothetical protein
MNTLQIITLTTSQLGWQKEAKTKQAGAEMK